MRLRDGNVQKLFESKKMIFGIVGKLCLGNVLHFARVIYSALGSEKLFEDNLTNTIPLIILELEVKNMH